MATPASTKEWLLIQKDIFDVIQNNGNTMNVKSVSVGIETDADGRPIETTGTSQDISAIGYDNSYLSLTNTKEIPLNDGEMKLIIQYDKIVNKDDVVTYKDKEYKVKITTPLEASDVLLATIITMGTD